MHSFLAAFALAAVLSALLGPLVGRFARRIGAVAYPGGRHLHGAAIPRLGGVAIALSCCAPLGAILVVNSGVGRIVQEHWQKPLAMLAGGLLLCAVGAVDDTRGVRQLTKLGFQVLASVMAFGLGLQINGVKLPLVGVLDMGVFALPVTVLWIVGITNAVNLIDGLDGLAAGIVFFAALTNFVVAWLGGSVLVGLVMACVMGSVIGFLVHNFNPARIFMGDSGSYFLGYLLATAALAGPLQKASTAVTLLVPLIALGVPVFDTLFAMVRRFLERRSIFSADRGHIHHRLIDLGLTHKKAVLTLYGVSIAFTLAALALAAGKDWEVGMAIAGAALVILGMVRFGRYFELIRLRGRDGRRRYDAHTERLRALLPRIARLGEQRSENDLWSALSTLARDAGWLSVSVARGPDTVWSWEGTQAVTARSPVSSRFTLGPRASASISFVRSAEDEGVTPQSELLLQLVADSVGRAWLDNAPALDAAPLEESPAAVPTHSVSAAQRS